MTPLRCLAALGPLLLTLGPTAGQTPAPKSAPTLVLLLDTFRIVEGPAERVGDGYRVTVGGKAQDVPAEQVLYAGASRAEVRIFLAARAAERTPAPRPAAGHPPLDAAASPLFAAKVQPILMNLCVRCHGDPASAGGLMLARVPLGYADPDATRRNAWAVAPFVRSDDPGSSPLLVMAVTPHGDLRDPPLPSRSHPAFRNLEAWVHWAAAPDVTSPTGAKPAGGTGARPLAGPTPARTAAADDPFSPDVFNRLVGGAR